MGIVPPSEASFLEVYPVPVTNPTSGVIVLPEIPVISAETGAPIECDCVTTEQIIWPERFLQQEMTEAARMILGDAQEPSLEASQKKSRKKKDES